MKTLPHFEMMSLLSTSVAGFLFPDIMFSDGPGGVGGPEARGPAGKRKGELIGAD